LCSRLPASLACGFGVQADGPRHRERTSREACRTVPVLCCIGPSATHSGGPGDWRVVVRDVCGGCVFSGSLPGQFLAAVRIGAHAGYSFPFITIGGDGDSRGGC
jgi:hypothetical protein